MQAVRSSGTTLERDLASRLWKAGCRCRRNTRDILGCPDFSVKSRKVAVFIDSCFWHGCEAHLRMPKTNVDYWQTKISRNRARDAFVTAALQEAGWTVIRVWEHDLREDPEAVVKLLSASGLKPPAVD